MVTARLPASTEWHHSDSFTFPFRDQSPPTYFDSQVGWGRKKVVRSSNDLQRMFLAGASKLDGIARHPTAERPAHGSGLCLSIGVEGGDDRDVHLA